MTGYSAGVLVPALGGLVAGMLIAAAAFARAIRQVRRAVAGMLRLVEGHARDQLDLARVLRPTLEDLQRYDPSIAEAIDVALADLDHMTPILAALGRGDYDELRRLRRTSTPPWPPAR